MLVWVRRLIRRIVFAFLRKLANTDEARSLSVTLLKGLLDRKPPTPWDPVTSFQSPYEGLGMPGTTRDLSLRKQAIFITGRFRSGTTLVWNLFRQISGVTSFYEPFNERRWFDPAARGSRVDITHRNVSDYWREYDGMANLGRYYHEDWGRRNLYMSEDFWDCEMKRYIEALLEQAPGRPVLQFNRVDFRLPWLRANFPGARIIHVYRHPRDQWCSFLRHTSGFPKDGSVEQFRSCDGYYLLLWSEDLKYHFPFLDPRTNAHPYQLFYYLWKLSYLFGRRFADFSLEFERLAESPSECFAPVLAQLGIKDVDFAQLQKIITKPRIARWPEYGEADWFIRHESTCETVLSQFFRCDGYCRTENVLSAGKWCR